MTYTRTTQVQLAFMFKVLESQQQIVLISLINMSYLTCTKVIPNFAS